MKHRTPVRGLAALLAGLMLLSAAACGQNTMFYIRFTIDRVKYVIIKEKIYQGGFLI